MPCAVLHIDPARLPGQHHWAFPAELSFPCPRPQLPQLLPYLLHGSRAAIRQVHYNRMLAAEEAYDAQFAEDPDVDDEG